MTRAILVRQNLDVALICISLMAEDVEHFHKSCVCVSMWMPTEARIIRIPKTGVMGGHEPPYTGAGNQTQSSTRTVHTPSGLAISPIPQHFSHVFIGHLYLF